MAASFVDEGNNLHHRDNSRDYVSEATKDVYFDIQLVISKHKMNCKYKKWQERIKKLGN